MRDDVEGEATAKQTAKLVGDRAKPIPIDDSLLENLNPMKRLAFIRKWQAAMRGE